MTIDTTLAFVEPVTSEIVITEAKVDPDHFMLTSVDTTSEPLFTVSEVAKFFFARTGHWIRWLETQNAFVLDGADTAHRRTEKGARVYTLSDVELMTHALAANGKINGAQASLALSIVKTVSRVWGFLE